MNNYPVSTSLAPCLRTLLHRHTAYIVPALVSLVFFTPSCEESTPTLSGTLTGEIVFVHSTVEGLNCLETSSLPEEDYIALLDVTGMDLSVSNIFSLYEFEPHIIAEGTVDSSSSRRSPTPFTIRYAPESIDLSLDYAIFVRYDAWTIEGLHLRGIIFTNHSGSETTPTRVLTCGHPHSNVEIPIDLIHVLS